MSGSGNPIWMLGLDVRKAFDTVDLYPLFQALRSHRLPEGYISLTGILHGAQEGSVNGSRNVRISRRVKQGDVLSPILFNCILGMAFGNWKTQIIK